MALLRSLLRGETVNFQGEIFQINGARMGFAPAASIPIYMTAVKAQMLRLAGELGDGVLLSAGCAPKYIAQCVAEVGSGAERAGKPVQRRDVAGFITTAVSENAREAIDASKTFLAYIFRNKHHAENIRMGGGRVDQEALAAAVANRDWEGARKFISDEVVHAHSISGTPAACRKRLEEFIEGGIDLPVLLPMGTQEMRRGVVELARRL